MMSINTYGESYVLHVDGEYAVLFSGPTSTKLPVAAWIDGAYWRRDDEIGRANYLAIDRWIGGIVSFAVPAKAFDELCRQIPVSAER